MFYSACYLNSNFFFGSFFRVYFPMVLSMTSESTRLTSMQFKLSQITDLRGD